MRLSLLISTVMILANAIGTAEAREQIRGVGSSTVYPFLTVVSEEFKVATNMRTPIIESTGTGGGFKLFCEGVGSKYPDITGASRLIKDSERELCAKNGAKDLAEIKIGLDAIVLANSIQGPKFSLTEVQVFNALARQVPKDGKLVANPYKNWNDIDPSLPAEPIEVYGPPPTSGTRDAFVELVLEKKCEKMPEFKAAFPDDAERKKNCGLIREDGIYVESGENDNLIIQKLASNPKAMGIFGYSFLEQNSDKVQGSEVDGVKPSFDTVVQNKYPISRPLFVYAKREHLPITNGLKEFLQELTSENAIGEQGYLTFKGLVPLKKEEREKQRSLVK